jgi:iron complex outermembrane receptor protein
MMKIGTVDVAVTLLALDGRMLEGTFIWDVVDIVPSTLTVNVAQTNLYGVEFEGQIQPTNWLTLGVSANYLHSEFGSNPITVLGNSQVFDQVPDSPRFTGGAFADIRVPVVSSVNGLLHADVYRQSSSAISTTSANNAGADLSVYALANFRAGIEAESGKGSLTVNLKNAFKKTYYVGGLPLGQITGYNILLPGDPRTFSIDARVNFGFCAQRFAIPELSNIGVARKIMKD